MISDILVIIFQEVMSTRFEIGSLGWVQSSPAGPFMEGEPGSVTTRALTTLSAGSMGLAARRPTVRE